MLYILVVDDSMVERGLVGGLLAKEKGLTIHHAENGQAALAKMEKQAYDLVLTDLRMPEMNGLELVSHVRKKHPRVPVVLVTAFGSERLAIEALLHGAVSYVPKANLNEQLVPTVLSILGLTRVERSYGELISFMLENTYSFALPNDVATIESLVDLMQQVCFGMELFDYTARVQMGVALEHALLNAMYHGNLQVSAEQKTQLRQSKYKGRELAWTKELAAADPNKSKRVQFRATITQNEARFTIRDEGSGYPREALPDLKDPTLLQKERGRGLILMHALMDEVTFNDAGNEVTLVKRGK